MADEHSCQVTDKQRQFDVLPPPSETDEKERQRLFGKCFEI